MAVAGFVAFELTDSSGSSAPAAEQSSGASTPTGTSASLAACSSQATVAVPPGYATAFAAVVRAYTSSQHAQCDPFTVSSTLTAAAPNAPSAPMLWLAETGTAVSSLPSSVKPSGAPTAVATSPLVVAFPAEQAQALGWPAQQFDTSLLQPFLLGTKSWTSLGRPGWGAFRLVIPDPSLPGSGGAAYYALISAARGGPLLSAPTFVNPSPADLATIRVEQAVTSTAPSDAAVLAGATDLTASEAATSGYVTTEAALLAHNASSSFKLDGFYLGGGSATVDLRAVPLSASTTSTDPRARQVRALGAYLESKPGATALRAAGLRDLTGSGSGTYSAQLQPAASTTPALLPDIAVPQLEQLWTGLHTRYSALAVLDVSGSMADVFPGTTVPKLAIVQQLVQATYAIASPKDASGIWYFHAAAGGAPVIDTTTGLGTNGTVGPDGQTHEQSVIAQAQAQTASGGTPLYQAIQQAYAAVVAAYQPGQTDELVVMTDGKNEDSTSTLTLAQLIANMQATSSAAKPIRIILFGLGADADMASLQAIAAPFSGKVAQVSSPADVPAAVTSALFS